MNVDFLHNQIIKDTISNKFIESFNENLVPALIAEYGSALEEIQFYEDHLASGFRVNGEFFYPLTIVCGGKAPFIRWIKWQVSNYRHYDNFNPYTYKGKNLLDFELASDVPEKLVESVEGKPFYAPGGAMPVIISVPTPDKTFLAGKYSQSFIDELSRTLTSKIESELNISGLSESGVVLEIPFLPGTFMEHICENTTYRRIYIKARGCNSRDLWIKWTRLDGEGTYTFSDVVAHTDIEFDVGEDVSGKIREKEYRYLTTESVDAYQDAMGRKNITEWRDMMRRVVRRGEVEKLQIEPVEELCSFEEEKADAAEPEQVVTEMVEAAAAVGEAVEAESAEFKENEEIAAAPEDEAAGEDSSDLMKMLMESLDGEDSEDESEKLEEMDSDLADLLKSAIGAVKLNAEENSGDGVTADAFAEDGADEDTVIPEAEEDEAEAEELEAEENQPEAEELEAEVSEEEAVQPKTASAEQEQVDKQLLEAKIREELEAKIREELELELELKNQEAERLREELEAKQRAEIREKELLAEAALAAIEAQKRLAKQREEEERQRKEEEARIAEQERRAAEEARIQAEREAEELRIKAETEARARAEREAREKAEAEAKEQEEKALMGDAVYVSKTAKLFFRNNVDVGITKRIHEIILRTITHYNKEDVYIRIKATIPDSTTVNLHFAKIPENEIPLLVNIIKVLGKSDLGIIKATLD